MTTKTTETTETTTIDATVYERGNGYPDVGDYLADGEGNLWRVVGGLGTIETRGVRGNHCACQVEAADWDDLDGSDAFPAAIEID